MARWTLAGSIGVAVGPLALGAAAALGFNWRAVFLMLAVLTLVLVVAASRFRFASTAEDEEEHVTLWGGMRSALNALRRRDVWRWQVLLLFSNLMLDVLYGYLALYFVDVVGVDALQAGVAVAVWTGVGLLGDIALLPLLERMRGLTYLRISAVVELVLYLAFLLIPNFAVKVGLLALIGFFNAGWYSILQAQLYATMPGQSGALLATSNVVGIAESFIPLAIGVAAESFGLGPAMWLLLLGPVALMIALPRPMTSTDLPQPEVEI
jgi:FSR family fosmidomycin resistance protein-like MFS transporter